MSQQCFPSVQPPSTNISFFHWYSTGRRGGCSVGPECTPCEAGVQSWLLAPLWNTGTSGRNRTQPLFSLMCTESPVQQGGRWRTHGASLCLFLNSWKFLLSLRLQQYKWSGQFPGSPLFKIALSGESWALVTKGGISPGVLSDHSFAEYTSWKGGVCSEDYDLPCFPGFPLGW